ncbi:recombinase family protein [Streptomyces sp. bgisy027]|uniref:recombinase family protein n=1 Tax=Streptomyces sp. bgisy027 TaxID=3413770 RepID=UPI003D74684D
MSGTRDRLYRQARDLEPLIDIVERTHVLIRPVKQGELDLASPSGRMVARILASVSTHEVEHAVERMKDKHAANRRAGVNHGGPRTFGFRAVKPKVSKDQAPETPKVDPREAALIREAAQAVLAYAADPETGNTLSGICRDWNARGIKSPRGQEWSIQALRGMLLSPRIAGRVGHKGEDVGPAQWEAIVEYDVWLALRNVLQDPARRSGASGDGRAPKYLGSGLYVCGRPGCGAVVRPGGARAGQRQQYRCTASAHLIRTAEPVDDHVERTILAQIVWETVRDPFWPPAAPAPDGPSMAELNARHAALTARLEALAEAFAEDDDSDPVEYRTASRKLKERIAAVEQEITDAVAMTAAASVPGPLDDIDLPELVKRHKADPEHALAWWRETYPLERRRKSLKTLAVVTLMPGRRGRPLGVAPGGLDPASVRIDWTGAA